MRRYTISVNDTTKVLDVEAIGANSFRVQIDGRLVDVTLEDHRDLAHSAVTPALVPRQPSTVAAPAAPAAPAASPRPTPAPAAAAPAAGAGRPTSAAASGGGGRDKMTAPMPGVILSVDVAAGARVQRGDTLMVLEAMKMKNELRAPRDGAVAEIYVAAGQQVKFGETLVRFES